MDTNSFPTKGNLILAKNTLHMSKQGYELLDKKRNILIKELMDLIEIAETIQNQIDVTFTEAYAALQNANIELGISNVEKISYAVPEEQNVTVKLRSIMGVEIPIITLEEKPSKPPFGFYGTTTSFDMAYLKFVKVKQLTVKLSEVENSAYRLADNIKKTQKRANALKNINIPKYEDLVSDIQNALEEKEREEFTRLKVIKSRK
jgi:V/A-type H+-transporting ATPase subunit D